MFKNFLFLLFCSSVVSSAAFAAGAEYSYPSIEQWNQEPIVALQRFSEGKLIAESEKSKFLLKKGYEFKTAFAVVTANQDYLRLTLNRGRKVEIFPKSKMQMPYVHTPTEGEDYKEIVDHLVLTEGQLRLVTDIKNKSQPLNSVKVETAFFNLSIPDQVDMVVQVDMKVPKATVAVLKGQLTVQFYDHEKKVKLGANQSVTFTGVLNTQGVVQYDYLLEKRKAPKGKVSSVQKTTRKEILKDISRFHAEEAERLRLAEQKRKALAQKEEGIIICRNPKGELNQCYWKMLDGLCYRFRCNASGEWADKTERPFNEPVAKKLCTENKAIAQKCDY